jgi:hypothetical protein
MVQQRMMAIRQLRIGEGDECACCHGV